MKARKRKFADGGELEVDALEEANKLAPIEMEPGPKAEPEKPKPRRASAKSPAPAPRANVPSSAPAPASSRVSSPAPASADSGDEYSGLARLKKLFGTAETRANVKPDIKASDVAAAKKERMERDERYRSEMGSAAMNTLKRIGARIGPQAMRERLKAEGYAKGGSVSSASKRADGCAMRGKTKGRYL